MLDSLKNELFKNVTFTDEQINMFFEIIKDDEVAIKVLTLIARNLRDEKYTTILELTENIEVVRRVGVRDKKKNLHFELKETKIDRKSAERAVDKLINMSVIYYENMPPYKLLHLTARGAQILRKIQNMNSKKENH